MQSQGQRFRVEMAAAVASRDLLKTFSGHASLCQAFPWAPTPHGSLFWVSPKLRQGRRLAVFQVPNAIPRLEAVSTGSQGGQVAILTLPVFFSVAPTDPPHVFPCPLTLAQLGSPSESVILAQTHSVLVLAIPVPSPSLCSSATRHSSAQSFPQDPEDRITIPTFYTQAPCLFQKRKSPYLPWVPNTMPTYPHKFVD